MIVGVGELRQNFASLRVDGPAIVDELIDEVAAAWVDDDVVALQEIDPVLD